MKRRDAIALASVVVGLLMSCATEDPGPAPPEPDPPAAAAPKPPASCRSGCTSQSPDCEGWVRVAFDVSSSGAVENARVLKSCPEATFDEAALEAVRGWSYPQMRGRRGLMVQLDIDAPAE